MKQRDVENAIREELVEYKVDAKVLKWMPREPTDSSDEQAPPIV